MDTELPRDIENDRDATWDLPGDVRRPLPELIADKLRELIDSAVLKPGDRLPTEPELATRFGVARTSLRTALQRLQLQDAVEVRRGRGWYVRTPSATDLDESLVERLASRQFKVSDILEVRIALEALAASLAAARAPKSALDEIAKLSAGHQNVSNLDKEELVRTDEAFHGQLVRAGGNEFLDALYQLLVPELREWRTSSYGTREVHVRSGNDHNQIVMFLRRRDQVGARTAMTTHLLGLYNDVQTDQSAGLAEPPADLTTFVGVDDEATWDERH
jgi:GntR family transcriptional repressor for pyruvate dehydrogenase complex